MKGFDNGGFCLEIPMIIYWIGEIVISENCEINSNTFKRGMKGRSFVSIVVSLFLPNFIFNVLIYLGVFSFTTSEIRFFGCLEKI
jgi:hypothetical protein